MEIYQSIYKPKKKVDPRIEKLNSIKESLKQLKKQLREDDNISLDDTQDQSVSVETVIDKVEDALIDAIKTLGATNEITSQLIDTVGKIEGQGSDIEVAEDASMDDFAVTEEDETPIEDINADKGYNNENTANMQVDMSEDGDIEAVNGESIESEPEIEEDDDFLNDDEEKTEGVTPETEYTDDEELDESEEMDREDNLRKTGQYELPDGKVDENQPGLNESTKYVRRFK